MEVSYFYLLAAPAYFHSSSVSPTFSSHGFMNCSGLVFGKTIPESELTYEFKFTQAGENWKLNRKLLNSLLLIINGTICVSFIHNFRFSACRHFKIFHPQSSLSSSTFALYVVFFLLILRIMKIFESFANHENLCWFKKESELLAYKNYEGRQQWSLRTNYPAKSSCLCLLMTNIANRKIRQTRNKKRWKRELHKLYKTESYQLIFQCAFVLDFGLHGVLFSWRYFETWVDLQVKHKSLKKKICIIIPSEEFNLLIWGRGCLYCLRQPFSVIDARGKCDRPFIMKAIRKC